MNRTSTRNSQTHVLTSASRERFALGMMLAIVFSFVAYALLINTTVLNIVEKQHIESEIAETKQNIAELEIALIERESDITLEQAQERGFDRIESRTFVTRDTNLSLRNE